MKKFLSLLLILMLALTACGKSIPSLSQVEENSESWANKQLAGFAYEDICNAWGEPSGSLFGLFGSIWELPGGEDYLTAYFHRETGILDHVMIQPMEN